VLERIGSGGGTSWTLGVGLWGGLLGNGYISTGLPGFEETGEAIWLGAGDSMEGLLLDIVGVVVAVGVSAKVGVLDHVDMSRMAPMLGLELVKSVGGIWVRAKKGLECGRQFEG
jgi:hypothetical protein